MSAISTPTSSAIPTSGVRLRRLELAAVATDPAVARERAALCRRGAVPDPTAREAVRAILDDVRARGAAGVRDANERFGGGLPDGRLLLDPTELRGAAEALPSAIRDALTAAAANVRQVAEAGLPASSTSTPIPGVVVERRWLPLAHVGAYVPGGSAPLPSSLVMTVVPAQVAGVETIVVATPAGPAGRPDPVTIGAASLLGVDTVLVAGGAQAIGALAFGLADIGLGPVDRIVGPGSVWVTAGKLEVSALVGIDLLAGPSEGLVLATPPADPDRVAADLLTQAEHGPDSPALLVTTDAAFADEVERAVNARLERAARAAILARALAAHGRIVLAPDLDEAVAFVNDYAPEHLSVDLPEDRLEDAIGRLRNAGSIFVGPWSPESAGDYATGANHVLPTGGLARSESPLSVERFGRYTQIQRLTRDGLAVLRPTIRALAEAEGLLAHRDAVEDRFLDPPGGPLEPGDDVEPSISPTAAPPTAPSSYIGEATDEEVAARYEVPLDEILRFDLNTSPAPPELAARILAGGRFETPLSEYPPSNYRRLVQAAAETYGVVTDEILVGAGADEILELCGKAFLPAGEAAVVPVPTYSMFRVITEQRGARAIAVPRMPAGDGWAIDVDAVRAAARPARLVWLCSPNNPTALPEPVGAIEGLLDGLAADADATATPTPIVVLDEAYAEFAGRSMVDLRYRHPNLVVVRTASKAYGLAGLRVGFALARPETIAVLAPYRPPGSVATTSVTVVAEALRDGTEMRQNVERVTTERAWLGEALQAAGWSVAPSVTNFLLIDFVTPTRAGAVADHLLRAGLVPRTFPDGHALAGFLRLTVRDREGNERLVAAARDLAKGDR